ncbi:hypothetical protein JGU66_09240 [Myxococcaceae bacterium JPH2]|nr:hypothetical protein [Myxococcaceae bacterium JPH2]
MKIVALVRPVSDVSSAAALLASAAGMAPAEARMRLAPEPPALLARLAPDAADTLVAKLRGAGLAALSVDEHSVEEGRTLVRTVTFADASVTFSPRSGPSLEMAWEDVVAIFRGLSLVRTQSEHTEKSRQLALGTALVTGGLKMTRTAQTQVRSTEEDTSQVIFVFARDGRGAVLREHALDFSCLGSALQPVRTANMVMLTRMLRERAPQAFHDERLMRLGKRPVPFVMGGSVQVTSGGTSHSRVNTAQGLDLLAEVMRLGLAQGLMP